MPPPTAPEVFATPEDAAVGGHAATGMCGTVPPYPAREVLVGQSREGRRGGGLDTASAAQGLLLQAMRGGEFSPPRDFTGVAAYVDRPKAHREEYAPGSMRRLPRSN